jgi:hypothetical protein
MSRIKHLPILAFVVATGAPACENGIPGAREPGRSADATLDFGPTAAYERRLIFLGPGQRLPSAAIVDFVAVSDSLGLRRGVRARVADGHDWSRVMDAGWEMERMREPWRLVPHGPLRLVVGDAGELGALVFRADTEIRLEPGPTLATFSPDPSMRLLLRQGRLALGADLVQGVILDAQLGRSLDAAASRDGRGDESGRTAAPDRATPAARPGAEALLLGEGGFYVVFAGSGDDPFAWLRHGQQDDVRRGARLAAVGWELDGDGFRVPNAWEVVGPSDLTGELVAEAVDGVDISDAPDVEGLGYAIVSGWILDRGVHRDVYGLIRHVR